jgi:hypothetical protein
MVDYIQGTSPQYDSVSFHLRDAIQDYTFIPHTGAYETFKSKGVDLITNDSLRLDIINTYDFYLASIVRMEQEEESSAFFANYFPAILERTKKMKPEYYTNGIFRQPVYEGKPYEDTEFMVLTSQMNHYRGVLAVFYGRQIKRTHELIERIDSELAKLQD